MPSGAFTEPPQRRQIALLVIGELDGNITAADTAQNTSVHHYMIRCIPVFLIRLRQITQFGIQPF